MTGIDLLGIAFVGLWIGFAVRKIHKNKKAGKCCGCSGGSNCANCKKIDTFSTTSC